MAAVFPYREAVVAFCTFVYSFHTWLDFRQLRALRIPKPPKYVADQYTGDEYKHKQAYNIDKWWFGFVHGAFSLVLTLASIILGYMPWLWAQTVLWLPQVGLPVNPVSRAIAYFAADSLLQMAIGIPWSAYSAFGLEAKHGFNKQTVATFVGDLMKKVMLGALIAPPLLGAFVWLLENTGPYVALYVWAFLLVVSIFFMTIYPTVIAPLFNKFDPLPAGSLREKIEALAGSLSFPLTKLYVIDGSRRSAHSNAYMYGFFKNKRIVLFDTLITQCSEEQVVAVLAHELGHWKLRHTPVLFVVQQGVLLVQLGLFTLVRSRQDLLTSFGFPAGGPPPAFIAFTLFQLIISPVDEVISYLSNILSRTFEFQADSFAVGLQQGEKLKEALFVLDKENKGALNVDPLYSAYHYSHPPLVERLRAIDDRLYKLEKKDISGLSNGHAKAQ